MHRLFAAKGVPRGWSSRRVGDLDLVGAVVMRQVKGTGAVAAGGAMLQNAEMSELSFAQRRAVFLSRT